MDLNPLPDPDPEAEPFRPSRRYCGRDIQAVVHLVGAATILSTISLLIVPIDYAGAAAARASIVARVVTLVVAGLAAMLIARTNLLGVYPRRDGAVVRNLLSTHKYGWAEIDHFELETERMMPVIGPAVMYLSDGSEVRITGIDNPPRGARAASDQALPLIDELNATVEMAHENADQLPVEPADRTRVL